MEPIRTHARGGLVLMTTAAALGGLVATGPTGAASAPGTSLVAGRLLDAHGVPASGVRITVSAMRTVGSLEKSTPVGSTVTDADGYFDVRPALEHAAPGNQYELTGTVGRHQVVYDFVPLAPADAPAAAGTATATSRTPVTEPATELVTLQAGAGVRPMRAADRRHLARAVGGPALAEADTSEEVTAASSSDRVAGYRIVSEGPETVSPPPGYELEAPAAGKSASTCSGTVFWVEVKKVYGVTWLPLHGLYTGAHSKQSYSWTRQKYTRAGVTLIGSDGKSTKGGLSYSTEKASSLTIAPNVPNKSHTLVYAKWIYHKWQGYCLPSGPPNLGGWLMDIYKWRPAKAAGDSRNSTWLGHFSCKYDHTIGNATTMTSTVTARWSGYYQFMGASLDASQTQSTSTSTTIRPDPKEVDPTYCSSKPAMGDSARFRETS